MALALVKGYSEMGEVGMESPVSLIWDIDFCQSVCHSPKVSHALRLSFADQIADVFVVSALKEL